MPSVSARCMFVFVCMGWRRVATVAKHSVAVSAVMGSGPCPKGLFICGSQEKAPAGEIPEVYLLSHSLQHPAVFSSTSLGKVSFL